MDLKSLTNHPHLGQYKKQAKDLLNAWRENDPASLSRAQRHHPHFKLRAEAGLALADAQAVLAREHGFESWTKFAAHVADLESQSSRTFLFEVAADAVVEGDVVRLKSLLSDHPKLARERSSRTHQATLLHYVAANGVENYRQRSPENLGEVTRVLLDAGSDVAATSNAYSGSWTPLGLLASSFHPHAAGVQTTVARLLLNNGAGSSVDLLLALAFGYQETASIIATVVGVDNVLAAAGLGEEELVSRWCRSARELAPECRLVAVPGQPHLGIEAGTNLEQALIWAARLGQLEVVRVLLERGVHPAAKGAQGFTAAHWASVYGRHMILDRLIGANTPLEQTNVHGGTVLATAVFAAVHPAMHFEGRCATERLELDYSKTVELLLNAGARTDVPMFFPTGIPKLDAVLRRYGADAVPIKDNQDSP